MIYGSPKGKHVYIDPAHPEALGICDKSRMPHLRKDLIQQMEWRGDRLVWNGLLGGKNYIDVPNPQLRAPLLPPDPVPVTNPRVGQGPEAQTPPAPPTDVNVARMQLQSFSWSTGTLPL